jgi:hypothetical protein
MRCPVCKNRKQVEIALQSEQFAEDIVELVKDTQKNSFLEALSECVEGDDYNWVGV